MRSLLVAPLLARVREKGHDPGLLLARFGLPTTAERDQGTTLALATLRDLFDATERLLGDPFVGLHLAEHLVRGTFGVVGLSAEAAPTVRAGLERLSRYHALLNDLVVVEVRDERGLVLVEQRIPGAPLCVGRHANEFFVANLLSEARRVTGRPLVPRRAFFAHVAPRDIAEIVRVVGTDRLQFETGANGVALDPADASAATRTADAPLATVLDAHAERLLAEHPRPRTLLDQVRRAIERTLPNGSPSLEALADSMRLAPRTLQRRLGESGTSLSEVVEALREELACARVLDPKRTTEEVAFGLGYSDTRAFLRAFKRWTGTTPAQYRSAKR